MASPTPSGIGQVKEFHETFGHPVKDTPAIPDGARQKLRIDLLREELNELERAMAAGDKTETLDALMDIQ